MRQFLWCVAALSGVGMTAMVPQGVSVREVLVAETSGKSGNLSSGIADLPQSGGPELFLPAASVLLGISILMYALLRKRRA